MTAARTASVEFQGVPKEHCWDCVSFTVGQTTVPGSLGAEQGMALETETVAD